VVDWGAYIPAPVPDNQNFYKAPHMEEWFVKGSSAVPGMQPPNGPNTFVPAPRRDSNLVLAEVKVVASNASLDSQPAGTVLRFDDPSARQQAATLLWEALGPCAIGAKGCVLVARPVEQFKPLRLVLQAATVPTTTEITAFFPRNPVTNSTLPYSDLSDFQVEPAGSNAFRVCLKEPVYGAADYLDWTDPLTADFDQVRKALERPYARIDCDYQQPFAIAIPNFVTFRRAAQTLSQRAQSYLLLGQPEAAWHELALVHGLCEILQAKPSGKPLTLVGAMINVAIMGVYTSIVEDGLRLHVWREPQLLAIERQLNGTDLLALVVEAFKEELAATSRTFETMNRGELIKLFNSGGSWSKFALTWMPRGWLYQNLAAGAETGQHTLRSVDVTNRLVLPRQVAELARRMSAKSVRRSPYTFLAAMGQPNYAKAVQTVARNQTLANQAELACALERYRLAQGQYPQKLDAVAPRFIETLPHDLIAGRPLNYHRTDGGGYLLYSVGWDEKDNGGVLGKTREEGDWVWEIP
jgi:Tfp pilus assembly protein PilE